MEADLPTPDESERHRIVAASCWTAAAITLWAVVAQGAYGSATLASGAAVACAASLFALGVLKRTGSSEWSGRILTASVFAVLAGLLLATGGSAPMLLFLGVWPALFALFVLSLREAVLWNVLWGGVLAIVAVLNLGGVTFPVQLEVATLRLDNIQTALVSQAAFLAVLFGANRLRNSALLEAKASEERYAELVRTSPIGILAIDPDGIIRDANPAMLTLLGAPSQDELVGHDIRETPGFQVVMESGPLRERLDQGEVISTEAQWTTRWGKEVVIRLHLAPLRGWRDRNGYQLMYEDVADRHRAVEELRVSEERHRLLFDNSADLIAELDEAGCAVFVSGNCEMIIGYPAQALVGTHVTTGAHPDDHEMMNEGLARAMGGETVALQPFRLRHGRGDWIWLESSLRPFTGTAGETHLISVTRNVTSRIDLERRLRQKQKMESLGLLAGGVAHDFNNLLMVYNAAGEILEDHDDPAVQDNAREILAATERGAALTRRLLSFGRAAPYAPKRVDLSEVLGSIEGMLRRVLPAAIDLRFDLAEGLPLARLDPPMVKEAVTNLALNAREAMPDGGHMTIRTLAIGPVLDDTASGQVAIEVSDSGIGMSEAVQARAFEPFFSTRPASEGSGLGLAMVYGLCEQAGGSPEIISKPGDGTTVRLLFPALAQRASEPLAEPSPTPGLGGDETLLLAEDEAPVRRMLGDALAAAGYRVLLANDGAEALELGITHVDEIALVVSDVTMPAKNGPEVLAELREHRPDLKALFISGHPTDGSVDARVVDGAEVMWKPFGTTAFLARVRTRLDDASSVRDPDSGPRRESGSTPDRRPPTSDVG